MNLRVLFPYGPSFQGEFSKEGAISGIAVEISQHLKGMKINAEPDVHSRTTNTVLNIVHPPLICWKSHVEAFQYGKAGRRNTIFHKTGNSVSEPRKRPKVRTLISHLMSIKAPQWSGSRFAQWQSDRRQQRLSWPSLLLRLNASVKASPLLDHYGLL